MKAENNHKLFCAKAQIEAVRFLLPDSVTNHPVRSMLDDAKKLIDEAIEDENKSAH